MAHSEFGDHQAWSELVKKRNLPSLKKLPINKHCESLVESPPEITPDFEAERDEILRQQPMTD